jgi:hypothetical protein
MASRDIMTPTELSDSLATGQLVARVNPMIITTSSPRKTYKSAKIQAQVQIQYFLGR